MHTTYSNPTGAKTIENWPFGSLRTTAMFYVETDPKKGQRACRRTIDPRNGRLSKPHKTTFHKSVRIVDGDDGKTYILQDAAPYGHLSVMEGNMKFSKEAIHENDPRYPKLLAMAHAEETVEVTP